MNIKKYKKINFIITIICVCLLLLSPNAVFAEAIDEVEGDVIPDIQTTELQPTDDQFLELRAAEITEIEGKNKQLTMELWGNELEFKRI